MKWNGIVSQLGHRIMAASVRDREPEPRDVDRLRPPQPDTPHGEPSRSALGAELLPQPPDADVDDVRARVEVVAPDLREQLLAADDLARRGATSWWSRRNSRSVRSATCPPTRARRRGTSSSSEPDAQHDLLVARRRRTRASCARTRAMQLVERERLRQVVARPELEAAELRRQVGARREDQHRQRRAARRESSRSTARPSSRGSSRSSTTRS